MIWMSLGISLGIPTIIFVNQKHIPCVIGSQLLTLDASKDPNSSIIGWTSFNVVHIITLIFKIRMRARFTHPVFYLS